MKLLTVEVERGNEGGRRFYERRGFAEVGEATFQVRGHTLELVRCQRPIERLDRPA
jgi:hypothetical protein